MGPTQSSFFCKDGSKEETEKYCIMFFSDFQTVYMLAFLQVLNILKVWLCLVFHEKHTTITTKIRRPAHLKKKKIFALWLFASSWLLS